MPQPDWSELEQSLGHVFRHRQKLEQALTHSSLAYERATGRGELPLIPSSRRKKTSITDPVEADQGPEGDNDRDTERDNEQLEFLGDAVLGFIVTDHLFRTFPDLNEGELTRLRAQLVSRRHLGLVGSCLSLGNYIRLGRGEERSGGRQKSVLLANALEAVIAALYLDGNLKTATAFIHLWVVGPYLDQLHTSLQAGHAMGDHKSALQEWLQAHKAGSPHYTVKAESGPDHRKRFLVELKIVGPSQERPIVAEGAGSTKKKAEQEAARLAYSALLELEPDLPARKVS